MIDGGWPMADVRQGTSGKAQAARHKRQGIS